MKAKKIKQRSTTGPYGRDEQGRFKQGNKCAKGNPFAKKVARLRAALLSAITPADIKSIIQKLITRAKAGDIVACREVLDRCIGKPIEMDFLERLEGLEKMLAEIEK